MHSTSWQGADVRVRIIGPGRAGTSLARALTTAGWDVAPILGRVDDVAGAADAVDLLIIATPDGAIHQVAHAVRPVASTLVAHMSGSLGLDVLARHARRAGLHPLVALPNPEVGTRRLVGAWFAVAGDPAITDVVTALGGRWFTIREEQRAAYHAAAAIASNHLVALLGQVQRVAAAAGVPFEPYLDLVRATVDNVADLGPRGALTGPAARGDRATLQRHLRALPPGERRAYRAMVEAAKTLATQPSEGPAAPPDGNGRDHR